MRIGIGKYTLATSPPGEISEKGCWIFVELNERQEMQDHAFQIHFVRNR